MSYIQNYGFNKTIIHNDTQNIDNEIKWKGNYDGNVANINIGMNNNGNTEYVNMKLTKDDLRQLFGIQPVDMSLEKRIMKDFNYNPVVLEGALFENKRRLYNKTKHKRLPHHKRKSLHHKRKPVCHKRKSVCHKRKPRSPCTRRNH
jgi:hypothetical protein